MSKRLNYLDCMDVQETLHFVDELVFKKTKKHLDDLQRKIIEDLLDGKTYQKISEENGYNPNHIGEVSRKLYQLLSESLGETINKSNFAWTIESAINSKIFDFGNNHVNYCVDSSELIKNKNNDKEEEIKPEKCYYDLTFAPTVINFYGREKESEILTDWLLNKKTKLVSVLSLKGVGKRHLIKRFIDLNRDEFEVIIWKNLKYPQALDLLLDNLLQVFTSDIQKNTDDKLRELLNYMAGKKCLFIFNEFHNIFADNQFAGHYQPEYKNYQYLLKLITKAEHQSSLILISEEKCDEMHCLDEELYPVKCLDLKGLDNIDIFRNIGLKDENCWLKLLKLYEGNPSYLKDIAVLIKDVYDGRVSEFLEEENIFITAKMQENLTKVFKRLSPIEKQIIQALSQLQKPSSRKELKLSLNLSATDFIKGLQSLQRRYLLTKIQGEEILFNISPILKKFIDNAGIE